jgi:hypothetical protein
MEQFEQWNVIFKLNDPHIGDAYQATLIQHLLNHNVRPRVDALYIVEPFVWAPHHEYHFNAIDCDAERAMHCATNNCRRKYFKKHTWTASFTQIIYQLRLWLLQ